MPTTVISVRRRAADRPALLADPNFVYVGRRFQGWKGSIWGNPFKPGMSLVSARHWLGDDACADGPAELMDVEMCVRWFRNPLVAARLFVEEAGIAEKAADGNEGYWVRMARHLPELRGKVLGCWCGAWSPGQPEIHCHGVVLAKLADALEPDGNGGFRLGRDGLNAIMPGPGDGRGGR